jgi:hypothetical protein
MSSNITRTTVIQIWFAALVLVVVAAVAFGAELTSGTGMLLTLSLVPPVIVFLLWPKAESVTAGDVIRGTDTRP